MRLKEFLFKNQTVRQTIAKNTFWLFSGQMVNRSLKAVFVIYAARVLGAQDYGVFSFALSFIMLVMIFSDIGVGSIMTREIPKSQDENERKKYLSSSFFIKLVLLVFCAALIVLGAFILPNKESAGLLWILLLMFVFAFFKDFFVVLTRTLEKMEIEALMAITEVSATVIAGFILLKASPTAQNLSMAYVIGALAGLIVSLAIFNRYLAPIIKNFDWALAKKILKWAWPFALGALIGSILTYTDTLMLGWLKPIQTVGLYAAGSKIPILLLIPASIVCTAILPALSRLSESREKFNQIVRQSLGLVMMIGLPLLAGGFILAEPIINLIFGSQYSASVPGFKILLFLIPINSVWSILGLSLFVKNMQMKTMIFSAIAAGMNIALNLLLIPSYGPAGAAIATVSSQFLIFLLGFSLYLKITRTLPLDPAELGKISLATLIMVLFLLIPAARSLALWFNIPAAALVYFFLLYLLRMPIFKEISRFRQGLR